MTKKRTKKQRNAKARFATVDETSAVDVKLSDLTEEERKRYNKTKQL